MPEAQREKLSMIFSMRATVRHGEFYAFGSMSLQDKKKIILAIVSLHEACLIDLGRLNDDFTAIIYDRLDQPPN
jgi:hypothetical protein